MNCISVQIIRLVNACKWNTVWLCIVCRIVTSMKVKLLLSDFLNKTFSIHDLMWLAFKVFVRCSLLRTITHSGNRQESKKLLKHVCCHFSNPCPMMKNYQCNYQFEKNPVASNLNNFPFFQKR